MGFEGTNEKEFNNFLKWYKERVHDYHENKISSGELIYFGKHGTKIAYISNEHYMISEILFTHFYYDFYDK